MTKQELLDALQERNACKEAVDWVKKQRSYYAYDIWRRCHRPDWLLWLADEEGAEELGRALDAAWKAIHTLPPDVRVPVKLVRAHVPWRLVKEALER